MVWILHFFLGFRAGLQVDVTGRDKAFGVIVMVLCVINTTAIGPIQWSADIPLQSDFFIWIAHAAGQLDCHWLKLVKSHRLCLFLRVWQVVDLSVLLLAFQRHQLLSQVCGATLRATTELPCEFTFSIELSRHGHLHRLQLFIRVDVL